MHNVGCFFVSIEYWIFTYSELCLQHSSKLVLPNLKAFLKFVSNIQSFTIDTVCKLSPIEVVKEQT